MALYRQVFIDFWKDPKITEEMSAEDRYVLLYLLTNPYTTQIGIYQITKRQIAFDVGYSPESVGAILDRFERLLGLIKYNSETREIAIKNWGKYNLKKGGKPIMDCIRAELQKVKDKELIEYIAISIPNESIKSEFLRYVNDTYYDTSTLGGQEEEKEEEKEEEEYNTTQSSAVVDTNIELIENKTHLKLSNNMKKIVNSWEKERLSKAIELFSLKKGSYFSLLEKIYKDDGNYSCNSNIDKSKNNYTIAKNKFHNFDEDFTKYDEDEFERIIQASQREKFK